MRGQNRMKKLILGLILIFCLDSSYADDWGCEVLLCLANPAGPMAVAECQPPIKKLYKFLDNGGSMPTCDMAGGEVGGHRSWAQVVYDPYDPCPTGLQPATSGTYVVQGHLKSGDSRQSQRYILDGAPMLSGYRGGNRACTANYIGQYRASTRDDYYDVFVFEKIVWQPAHPPRAIDIYIDGKFDHRVRG